MRKIQYRFDPRTMTYQVVTIPFKMRFYRILRQALVGFIIASVANFVFSYFFYTPKMYRINQRRSELMLQHQALRENIDGATKKLSEIKQRDYNVYRSVFGMDSMKIDGIYTSYPADKYAAVASGPEILAASWQALDQLARLAYFESKSFDQVEVLAADKELMAAAIPTFWPMDRQLIRNIGKFGWRIDPVYGGSRFHSGIDFSGKTGTPIYSTGDGKVIAAEISRGYGKEVLIDHGYGYRTRYAHLSYISVVAGQTIRRGEQVGELGSTGKSTGPHLHYEVIYRGEPMNPMGYLSRNISREDFMSIIERATDTTYEKD